MGLGRITGGRVVRIYTLQAGDDPDDPPLTGSANEDAHRLARSNRLAYSDSLPQFTISPQTPWGQPTRGILLGIVRPNYLFGDSRVHAAPGESGFSMFVWIRNPVTGAWMSSEALTGLQFGTVVALDVGPAEIRFQVENGSILERGAIDLHIMEQG